MGRVMLDPNWKPLHPISAARSDTTVTLKFHNPSGTNLVLDTTSVTNMTDGMFGFRWIDSAQSATVTNVSVTGTDTVVLTLSNVPTGSDPHVGIADANDGTVLNDAGQIVFQDKRSNLRDSNTDVDILNAPMWNWAAHFQINVS